MSAFGDALTLPLADLRPSLDADESPYKLDYHGFTARRAPSKLHSAPYSRESWNDPELIRTIYVTEVEDLVKRVTGCKTALVESAVIRNICTWKSTPTQRKNQELITLAMTPVPVLMVLPRPKGSSRLLALGARTHIRKYHRNLAIAVEHVIEAENALLESGIGWNELKDHYAGIKENGVS
ncbi:hypothetical protein N7453_001743 [Penicillium expansum]|nr:hypothetical protein N7453_001743 [Penicillium expansum]